MFWPHSTSTPPPCAVPPRRFPAALCHLAAPALKRTAFIVVQPHSASTSPCAKKEPHLLDFSCTVLTHSPFCAVSHPQAPAAPHQHIQNSFAPAIKKLPASGHTAPLLSRVNCAVRIRPATVPATQHHYTRECAVRTAAPVKVPATQHHYTPVKTCRINAEKNGSGHTAPLHTSFCAKKKRV